MKIEVGKYYRTRNDKKAGPVRSYRGAAGFPFIANLGGGIEYVYTQDGKWAGDRVEYPYDLVAEWTDEASPTVPDVADVPDALSYVATVAARATTADIECRRLCTSILNGHVNGCPYARGVR